MQLNTDIKVEAVHNELLKSTSYILHYDNKVYLVDCGDYEKIIRSIGDNRELSAVFLTHCHQDHVYGLTKLLEKYPHATVFCSLLTLEGLKDEEQNLSYIIPQYPINFDNEEQVIILGEGIRIVNGLSVEVILTPGHSDDSITYIIGDCIFTGDSYIPFAKVFTKWPRSNKSLAVNSEMKIISLIKERHLNVFCGHWE